MSLPPQAPSPNGRAPSPWRARLLGSVALSLVVLGVVTYFTFDWRAFVEALNEVNPLLLTLGLGTLGLRVLFGAWRLHYVSHRHLTLRAATRCQLVWDFSSNVTPSAIGGGPFAALFIARDQRLPLGEATAILLFAILLDQLFFAFTIVLILAALPFMPVLPSAMGTVGGGTFVLYLGLGLGWVAFFAYTTFFRPELIERLARRILRFRRLRRFRERVIQELLSLQERTQLIRSQPPDFFLKGFLLTTAAWISRHLLLVFLVWSVYPEADAVLVFMRTLAMTLGSVILPTPGGAGGVEGLYVLFIGPLMPRHFVAPTLLLWRLLSYYVFIAIGLFLTGHHMQRSLRRRRRLRPAPEPAEES
ncbi:lysylphosphatidylglycerol synthase transmembrane domain-containing protein [Rhodothermus marinus]|uniref:lysylphosphatidylglycerol synthase transmembrane domain-containing protein n=1 Tax=Rhodothermus marinus TaxID=29549 RepID=UPI001DBBAD7A|nr:lysylphosphatidylglycerol synthase transmembrane domain-containing protein [Rhodothermus marinus]MBO2491665.1 flippase-like domain-containing protein [Rhodothermus marinus]